MNKDRDGYIISRIAGDYETELQKVSEPGN